MKLLLTSGGLLNQSIINALLDLTGKPFAELNLAFIPTASNVEKGDKKDWLIEDLIICKNLGFKSIDIVDISALSKEMWQPRLEEADVFFVEGGNTSYLMHWMEKSGLKELLPKMLETKVYVGVSAGTMIACKHLDVNQSESLYSEDVLKDYQNNEGLGWVDFLIRPHLNSPHFPGMTLESLEPLAKELPETFYAIDDESAIKVRDGSVEVISQGQWKKFN